MLDREQGGFDEISIPESQDTLHLSKKKPHPGRGGAESCFLPDQDEGLVAAGSSEAGGSAGVLITGG
jgi:hypothetical protein